MEEIEQRYQSTIQLFNITQYNVGYFFCVTNRTQSAYDYSNNFLLQHRHEHEISGLNNVYVYVDGELSGGIFLRIDTLNSCSFVEVIFSNL